MNIPFTNNYQDLSSEKGYQFKFICEKCGNGYISSFQKSTTGMLSGVLGIAGGLLGGAASKLASTSDDVHRMSAGPQHDKALEKAVKEISPLFVQCKRCGDWVCREVCWNEKRGLCKSCAPELGEEMSAAQAGHSKGEAWAHACMSDKERHLKKEDWSGTLRATCPKCQAKLEAHAKFCPECGAKISGDTTCKKCNAKVSAGAKFCPKCGEKV